MNIINAENIQLSLGHFNLLDHADFFLKNNERVGLIGRNGSGKSTFLKILAGQELLDSGVLHIQKNLKIVYVAQATEFNPEATIFDQVTNGLGDIQKILQQYHWQSMQVANNPNDESVLEQLYQIQLELENNNGWMIDALVQKTLTQLNLPSDELIKNLSGGQKKRVQLAEAWVQNPDILLLDEPTNHLDIDAIISLENLLINFPGSLIVVTHDRRFLDKVVNRIVELDRGVLTSYPGNFKQYQVKKDEEILLELEHNRLFDKFHAQEEAWIRQGIKARRKRNEGRVRRLEELRVQRQARRERQDKVHVSIAEIKTSGKIISEFKQVSFAYPNKNPIIYQYSSIIQRGDKIGLIGPNGIGKTTLLKLILGQLQPTAGEIILGSKQEVAYFDQFRSKLKDSETIFATIGQGNDTVNINGTSKHVISYLEDFLFHPSRVNSPVASLSGGEKNRLLLAQLFTQPANILILDEPTNDLDIETQEILEQLLKDFNGTVFLVSHDRELLDNIVTQSIVFEGNGVLINYIGGYTDYQSTQTNNSDHSNKIITKSNRTINITSPALMSNKLNFNEKKELEILPQEIEALELEQKTLNQKLLESDVFKRQQQETIRWQKRVHEIEILLLEKLNRWEELDNKQPK